MSVQEIESAIAQLPPAEVEEVATWLDKFRTEDWDAWDEQIARDFQAGRFDAVIQKANEDFDAGRCRPL